MQTRKGYLIDQSGQISKCFRIVLQIKEEAKIIQQDGKNEQNENGRTDLALFLICRYSTSPDSNGPK